MNFKEITPRDLQDNFFHRIGTDWMLVGAGTPQHCNAMTASWGQLGHVWNTFVSTVYVRPQRYTYEFVEQYERYSISFFAPGTQRQALNIMGSQSGRDGDKIAQAGLTVAGFGPHNTAAFHEANLVLICRKLYSQDIKAEHFVEPAMIETYYPERDFHRMYVGAIEQVLVRE